MGRGECQTEKFKIWCGEKVDELLHESRLNIRIIVHEFYRAKRVMVIKVQQHQSCHDIY